VLGGGGGRGLGVKLKGGGYEAAPPPYFTTVRTKNSLSF
jgi:hypothetical protein